MNFLHKTSTDLAKNHGVIVMEDLMIGNMTKSAKGTANDPGKNVKQKAGLIRAILAQGWGYFKRMLEYKLKERGGRLVLVNPAYTSQRCSKCGHVAADNRKTQSQFTCVACGHSMNADHNAALNILAAGQLPATACGGLVHRDPVEAGTHQEVAA